MKNFCGDFQLCIKKGHINCLKNSHINCLKNIYKLYHQLNEVCNIAAKNGQLECLKYAHECLKYAYENGCPWSDSVYKYSIR